VPVIARLALLVKLAGAAVRVIVGGAASSVKLTVLVVVLPAASVAVSYTV
jgi:hypothetical protein